MNYVVAFDIGIGSIGIAIISGNKVVYLGVRTFDTAQEASVSRKNRSARRNASRKKWRKKQLIQAFSDFNVLSKEEIEEKGYLCFTTNSSLIEKPKDKTVYHLRKRALSEKVTKREILLCIYNILQARGHFLMDTIDFEKDTINIDEFSDMFFGVTQNILNFTSAQKEEVRKSILTPLFDNKISSKEIKNKVEELEVPTEEYQEKSLVEIIKLLSGYKASIKTISETIEFDKEGTVNINDLKKSSDELDVILQEFIELYDLIRIHMTLANHNYLCEVAVDKMDGFEKIIKNYGVNSDEYKDALKLIANDAVTTKNHYRVVKNIQNNYPNGLYVKEAAAILKKQSEFYPEINSNFINVCKSIISARIPYFIGPLNEDAKNAWVIKEGKIKYSYDFSYKDAIDVTGSITEWKKRMISHCTYLSEEEALPTGSFLGETFNIINELNILKATDKNGGDYYLTHNDKVKIFNELFLKQKEVTYKEVAELLDIYYFGVRKNSNQQQKFNNKYTLYHSIKDILPELKIDSIEKVLSNDDKIKKIEDIILSVNLYDEEKTKKEYFENDCGYSLQISKRLASLKSKSFYSYSKKFICDTPMNECGESLLSELFNDNTPEKTNEQMTLIANAIDKDGQKIDYIANKYVNKIRSNGGLLNYNLLMEDGKPTMPISRPVVRSLNECMKVYNEIIKVFGVPDRVVIETARDFPDFQVVKERTAKTYDKNKKLYESIQKQLKEKEYKKYASLNQMKEWNDIKDYVNANKQKIELYITQMGTDMLSGEEIDINQLEKYEIDHILPRGFGDNSFDDKMLISKKLNAKKKDRLPIEFLSSEDNLNSGDVIVTSDYLKRVNALYDLKLISEKKYRILTLENSKGLAGFVNQNLVDTRYIIREFMSILKAYSTVNDYDTHIVALKSAYTSLYRNAFNMNKVRDYGDQHHAHDAALLAIADRTLSAYYPNYDSYKSKSKDELNPFSSYQSFINTMGNLDNEDSRDKLNQFIYYAYKMAFGESYKAENSVINQVKEMVPYYSQKVEKNYTGQYFDINPLKPNDVKDTDVLSLLGINNEKKAFSGINSAAVDFYKYTDSKGKKQHLAVHIPKVIIDNNGNINKEKYLKLIKDHYAVPELIDENGELKEYYFRFRAYKNDLIYETNSNVLLKFNIGSIVNKKLECKFVNVFSYNDISNLGRDIAFRLIKKFDIKTKSNPNGIKFGELEKEDLVADIAENYWRLPFSDKKVQNALEMVKDEKTLNAISNHLAFLTLIINRAGTPPTITGQYTPVINSNLIKKDSNAQYVKIKSNILGIRWYTIDDGNMIIVTPDEIPGHYKKITREKFTWNLKNSDL